MALASRAQIELTAQDKTGAAFNSVNRRFGALNKEVSSIGSAFRTLQGAFVVGIGVGLVKKAADLGDEYANINARLKLASGSAGEFAKAQREVFNIAQRSGVALESTAGLYASLSRNAEALGASQNDLLRVTETIGKAFQVSGASAAESSAAIIQLGQAFASGVLRGDELNSVLEQAPRLAKAIADGLGVTIGQLRALGKEGKLTAADVFTALQEAGRDIDREFSELPNTVGFAATKVGNSMLRLVGEYDKVTGATRGFANALSTVLVPALDSYADKIKRLPKNFEIFGGEILSEVQSIRLSFLVSKIEDLQGALRADPGNPALINALREARSEYDKLSRAAADANEALKTSIGTLGRRPANEGGGGYRREIKAPPTDSVNVKQLTADQKAAIEFEKLMQTLARPGVIEAAQMERRSQFLLSEKDYEAQAQALQDLIDAQDANLSAIRDSSEAQKQAFLQSEKDYEAVDASLEKLADSTDKTSNFAQDMGLAFSSAFEDAIVAGGSLRDLLRGLEQDIVRIVTRKLVTEPLGDTLSGLIKGAMSTGSGAGGASAGIGSFFSNLFSGFFADGGYIAPGRWGIAGERGPEPVFGGRTGLTVSPSGASVVINQNFARGTDMRTVSEAAARTGEAVQRALARNR